MKADLSRFQFEGRSKLIDYDRLSQLCYVGNYTLKLPVSLTRMIENAYDWAHLPFVHSNTFHDIELVEEGDWGWRAEVGSAKSGGARKSMLELLVDADQGYWATTVLSGVGTGVEIHTQAVQFSARQIEIDVKFYLPEKTNWLRRTLTHWYLKKQYKNLYAEDKQLMQGRQTAIDERKRWGEKSSKQDEIILVGREADLNRARVHIVEGLQGRFCVAYHHHEWLSYSAVCSHQLGDLSQADVGDDGTVTCPWHGYKFYIRNGENLDQKCSKLNTPTVALEDGMLLLRVKQ